MEIKETLLGYLIMSAMVLYLAAVVVLLVSAIGRTFGRLSRGEKPASERGLAGWIGQVLFGGGFVVSAAAFVLRWEEVGHAPLQNMFEVFLCLGMLIWPISLFCRRVLRSGSEWYNAFLGFVLLFPAAFVFQAYPQHLPPALQSFLFIPHVASYMLSYIILAMAATMALWSILVFLIQAIRSSSSLTSAVWRSEEAFRLPGDELPVDVEAHRLVMLGFPLLTLGLALGAWWGKLAWGDYWNWDPKELWSLVSWLVFLVYFHLRAMYGRRFPMPLVLSLILQAGIVAIIITLLWVNLSRVFGGMHSYAS
jgi:cytochrome c-type biogenesis protein CcsB